MDLTTFFLKATINIAAATILTFLIYRLRYGNKQLAVSMLMLNVFVFCIMGVISTDNFGLQAGLGLFAILSIFRFRSKNFEQMDIAYFFGAVALATVNGITPLGPTIFVVNGLILAAALIVDMDGTIGRMQSAEITLDRIPAYLFDEPKARAALAKELGVTVHAIAIEEVDYVKDTATVRLNFIGNGIKTKNVNVKQ
jgi:hypothetical protein